MVNCIAENECNLISVLQQGYNHSTITTTDLRPVSVPGGGKSEPQTDETKGSFGLVFD